MQNRAMTSNISEAMRHHLWGCKLEEYRVGASFAQQCSCHPVLPLSDSSTGRHHLAQMAVAHKFSTRQQHRISITRALGTEARKSWGIVGAPLSRHLPGPGGPHSSAAPAPMQDDGRLRGSHMRIRLPSIPICPSYSIANLLRQPQPMTAPPESSTSLAMF